MTEKQSAHCSAVERNEGVEIGSASRYRFVRRDRYGSQYQSDGKSPSSEQFDGEKQEHSYEFECVAELVTLLGEGGDGNYCHIENGLR